MRKVAAAALAFALAAPAAASAGITAVVLRVIDGDTLVVRMTEHVLQVDLRDVDAPEAGQPYAGRALRSLAEICRRGAVVEDFAILRGRAVVAEVHCDGTDAGAEQVRRGLATVDAASAPPDSPLHRIEQQAKAQGRGMWGDAAEASEP